VFAIAKTKHWPRRAGGAVALSLILMAMAFLPNHSPTVADGGSETYVFVLKWGAVSPAGHFKHPWGVAVDGGGNVYVADTDNHRIQKFDSNGNFITKWGSRGLGNGEFRSPSGVAVDAQGFVYVADTGNNRIQKFMRVVSTIYLPLIVKNY
jgi:DNA-binding beta-propeller fold protein YncE